ncbi:anti-sigma factor RsbA family regulatory protein [Streptomyces prasinopilosus]|uniref:anti-sigma factor RsbA family regulatory protein n=1 Tax=Streptomyces prasinopilosus TaxID=67344 RepID=UPI0006EB9451|nr:anti-sigma factor RsbA family regulatory protein [Streptomyces prasinopilosus]
MTGTATPHEPFVHPALFYRGTDQYIAGTVPFLREGLDAGEPAAVAAPPDRLELIREGLGERAAEVRFIDMTRAGRNPGRIIPGVLLEFADAQPGARRVRIIGEPIWQGRSAVEYPACVQHEALINAAFTGRAVTILCPYDAARLEERALNDALATHPVVIDAEGETRSTAYGPERIIARYNEPLLAPLGAATSSFAARTLPDVRDFAVSRARSLGVSGVSLGDLELAVAELTTNSVVHGAGSGILRIWAEGDRIVCEVHDGGQLTDPLAGRRRPNPTQPGGRGLLLVHQLADLVRIHTGPDGTTVRCYLPG